MKALRDTIGDATYDWIHVLIYTTVSNPQKHTGLERALPDGWGSDLTVFVCMPEKNVDDY